MPATLSATDAGEALLVAVLVQLAAMIGVGRLGHVLARRVGQPGVVGEILAGLALGPSLLGALAPDLSLALFGGSQPPAIGVIGQIGLTLLMFQIGCGFEFGRLGQRGHARGAVLVAAASVTVPFVLGLALGRAAAPELAPGQDARLFGLFLGNALAITALPVLGRILVQYGLAGRPLGVVAVAAAAVNDVAGWLLLAALSALAAADLPWLALILAAAVAGKVVPVWLAARAAGWSRDEALALGALMNTRGLMELIVLDIGHDLGVLPRPVFTMLVVMAVATTLMTGPWLDRLLPRIGHAVSPRRDG